MFRLETDMHTYVFKTQESLENAKLESLADAFSRARIVHDKNRNKFIKHTYLGTVAANIVNLEYPYLKGQLMEIPYAITTTHEPALSVLDVVR